MDHAGHAAFETLKAIEERLVELLDNVDRPNGREVAWAIVSTIRSFADAPPSPAAKPPEPQA